MDEMAVLRLQEEIVELEQILSSKKHQLEVAETLGETQPKHEQDNFLSEVNNHSSPDAKIALFRSLFKGREDVYARRFESKKTGKSGYQPACHNEWVKGVCEKPKISCGNCTQRSFEPITDTVIQNHLTGFRPAAHEWGQPIPFVMGLYPLLENETCNFLALDFDSKTDSPSANQKTWQEDAKSFIETCKHEGIAAALERSRSGNGAHAWIFFEKPVSAAKARKLGSFLMTRTLDRRPEIGLDSFDRFFPNQDTLPKGGFGNLIALPLQKAAREKNHSVLMNLGDVRYNKKIGPPLFTQRVLPRFTSFSISEQETKDATMNTDLTIQNIFHDLWKNEARNNMIVHDILKAYGEGRECLILSERIEHLDMLRESLQNDVPHLFVLKGGMGKKQLKTIMNGIQNVPEDEHRIILATGKYLGEGFDLPCLDTLFLVFPFSWKGTLIQYTGRLNREYYGKKEIQVYDYVDEKVPVLLRMYSRRLKGYKSLGFELTISD
jgi:hypothetical protein